MRTRPAQPRSEAPTEDDSSPGTRARLLEAAGEVFASEGYRNATVRDICSRAGSNIASVNYHFRGKEPLYQAAISYALRSRLEGHPIPTGRDAPAEDRLRVFVHELILRVLEEGRPEWHAKLIAREMIEPTTALDRVVAEGARPQFEALRAIVADILGEDASPLLVTRCAASVVGQCMLYRHCKAMIERLIPDNRYDDAGLRALADHITDFSLAALRSLAPDRGGTSGRRTPSGTRARGPRSR